MPSPNRNGPINSLTRSPVYTATKTNRSIRFGNQFNQSVEAGWIDERFAFSSAFLIWRKLDPFNRILHEKSKLHGRS